MSVDGRGGGGGGAMWMVEVTKNKEASKEVLMRAILDLRSVPSPASRSSPVLKLVYVMTELQDARSLNGASEEEVFRQEAAWEMSKRNAESLLRSFLTMAQQRNVSPAESYGPVIWPCCVAWDPGRSTGRGLVAFWARSGPALFCF